MSFGHVTGKYGLFNNTDYYKGQRTDVTILNCIYTMYNALYVYNVMSTVDSNALQLTHMSNVFLKNWPIS